MIWCVATPVLPMEVDGGGDEGGEEEAKGEEGAEGAAGGLHPPAPRPRPQPQQAATQYTHELITIRLGGMAARNSPIGRKAASAFRKSLKPSPPL